MRPPRVDLFHLKTSRFYQDGTNMDRYWFGWANRRKVGKLVLRLELLDEAGNSFSGSEIQLPPVRIQGYVPSTNTRPQQLIYNSDVRIHLDVAVGEGQPVFFSYCTVGIYKSESVRELLKGPFVAENLAL